MTRWEYKIIKSEEVEGGGVLTGKSAEAIEKHLNELGSQGWEIIGIDIEDFDEERFVGLAKRPR
jgi:hypothetical protein